jgi:hypothetical protein
VSRGEALHADSVHALRRGCCAVTGLDARHAAARRRIAVAAGAAVAIRGGGAAAAEAALAQRPVGRAVPIFAAGAGRVRERAHVACGVRAARLAALPALPTLTAPALAASALPARSIRRVHASRVCRELSPSAAAALPAAAPARPAVTSRAATCTGRARRSRGAVAGRRARFGVLLGSDARIPRAADVPGLAVAGVRALEVAAIRVVVSAGGDQAEKQ